jgi:hypothetical protein
LALIQARARASMSSGESASSCTSPSSCIWRGFKVLPSIRIGSAFSNPRMRTSLVTPPAPGRSPRVTSGRPSWIFASSSAMRQCADSASSQPPPSAAPATAATTGRPQVSRRRKSRLVCWISLYQRSPSASVSFSTSFNSAPAKKVFLAEARITPVILSFSARMRSTASVIALVQAWVMVLTGAPGASKVRVTMPSASVS